jgi:hypothetical protein
MGKQNFEFGRDEDFWYDSGYDFVYDKNDCVIGVIIQDNLLKRAMEYKVNFTNRGGYITFHGKRCYILDGV